MNMPPTLKECTTFNKNKTILNFTSETNSKYKKQVRKYNLHPIIKSLLQVHDLALNW